MVLDEKAVFVAALELPDAEECHDGKRSSGSEDERERCEGEPDPPGHGEMLSLPPRRGVEQSGSSPGS